MSNVQADNLEGSGGVIRNNKTAIQLSDGALNVTGGLEVDNTANVVLPVGTDADRPTPAAGQIRVNNTSGTGTLEGYNGTEWIPLTAPPAQAVAGSSQENPAASCYDMLTNDNITQNGFYWINSSGSSQLTWCFMQAPWGEPDYSLVTPYGDIGNSTYNSTYGWFHQDDRDAGNMTGQGQRTNPGIEYFCYFCDNCSEARETYNYPAPSGHVIHWYGARTHCGGDRTFGFPGMTNSCSNNNGNYSCNQVFGFTGVSTTNVGFRQTGDNCGDPNEATLVVVSNVEGTTRPAPSINTWKTYFRDCSWRYGGVNSRNG